MVYICSSDCFPYGYENTLLLESIEHFGHAKHTVCTNAIALDNKTWNIGFAFL